MKCAYSAGIRSPARTDKPPTTSRASRSDVNSPTFLNVQDLLSNQPSSLKVFSGSLNKTTSHTNIICYKSTTSHEIVQKALDKFGITDQATEFQLAEVCTEENKVRGERRLCALEHPLELQLKWNNEQAHKNFYLRRKVSSVNTTEWIHRTEDLSSIRDVLESNFSKQRDAPDDLCQLSSLTEQNLLSSLATRFEKDNIYTYVNSILIAANPFKDLPIYNVDLVLQYNNKRRDEMPPHIFAVANEALRNMLAKRQNQCMVISGESGSGKTETTRHIIHWLTTTQNKRGSTTGLAQSILGAGELLEAFGNAQTLRNKNSSRFGRFIQLEYRQDGSVHGAIIEKYLLEKSRITNISPKERSYHVFYYLIAGCPKPLYDEIELQPISGFNYLNQSVATVDGVDDHGGFFKLKRSMIMVGISEELQKNIFKVLSAILHIGNITFKQQNNTRTSEECAIISDKAALETVAKLLCVNPGLLKDALTTKKSFARGEQFITHFKRVDATATRDTLAKALYTYLFDFLLSHVNRGLVADNRKSENYLSIGLLDIFGFEDFNDGNRFEQFCINFANEQLQHFFDQHIFKLEQDEYTREKITWTMVGYKDNESCLDLFKGKPVGLLHLLDEENSFPGGSDQSLLQKFNDNHGNHENYTKTQIQENAFEIRHYAGPVQYKIDEFLEKNRGHMRADIVHVLKSSTSLFIKRLIGCDPLALARWTLLRNYIGAVFACRNAITSYTLNQSREQGVSFRPRNKSADAEGKSVRDRASAYMCDNPSSVSSDTEPKSRRCSESPKKAQTTRKSESHDIVHVPATKHRQARQQQAYSRSTTRGRRQPRSTVVGQFLTSLNSLVNVLNSANPHFIRCIKSNYDGKPNHFEADFVDRQLRYTGMLETIQIRKASYPIRYNKEEFSNQFRLLMRESQQRDIAKFFEWAEIEKGQYQIGLSKVFMREGPLQILNEYQDRLILARVQFIQSQLRGWLCRLKFRRMRAAAILIQRSWREYSKRERDAAASIISSTWKMYRERRHYLQLREAAVIVQRIWRRSHNVVYPPAKSPSKADPSYETALINDEHDSMIKDTLMRDILNTFSFLDDDQPMDDDVRLSPLPPDQTLKDSSLTTLSPSNGDPTTPLSPHLDPVTTHGRAFTLPDKVHEKLEALDQEMPEELEIETGRDYPRESVTHDGIACSKASTNNDWNDGMSVSPLQRGGPARTPYTRSQSVTEPPATTLIRSSSGYNSTGSWNDVQNTNRPRSCYLDKHKLLTTSFKFMRSKEEQDTNAHFSGRRNRKRRSIQKTKKGDGSNRLSRSLEDLEQLELGIVESSEGKDQNKSESSPASALPYLTHIFKNVPAPRGSVCNSCCKKLQARIFARALQCQAQTCAKIFHRNCSEKAGQCMPTYEQPKRVLANNLGEILMLEKFILQKIKEMRNQGEKVVHDKVISKIFISVLKEFQEYLTRTQAALSVNPNSNIFNLYHEECTTIFEHCLTKVITISHLDLKSSLETKHPVKAMFDSMLENFMYCKHETEFKEDARRSILATRTVREQLTLSRTNKAGIIEHQGHRLVQTAYGIVMTCASCKKRINILERCKICQECGANFHAKCYKQSTNQCTGIAVSTPSSQPKPFFGTPLQDLVASEGVTVPRNLDKIMLVLEQNGLYTLGLYRVNANQNQLKSLKTKLSVNNSDLSIDGIVPSTLSAMVKMFFRELPEPILTFSLYEDFMRNSKIDIASRTRALLELVHKLPRVNFLVFERLVYHLAQVANEEDSNKMNAGSLAVIFAPNLLRPQKEPSAMQALEEVKHRTVVIKTIVDAVLLKYKAILSKITGLDSVDPTPESERSKAECLVQLAQLPQPDDVYFAQTENETDSGSPSASLSTGAELLRNVTRNRPYPEKRAPPRRHSASPSSSPTSSFRGGPKSIADGIVRKKDAKGRKQRTYYGGSFKTNHL